MTFAAKYPGRCPRCGEFIKPGDEVEFDDLDVVHADCDDVPTDFGPAPVCPRCFIIKPCECDS